MILSSFRSLSIFPGKGPVYFGTWPFDYSLLIGVTIGNILIYGFENPDDGLRPRR
jgi:hypothetical protein